MKERNDEGSEGVSDITRQMKLLRQWPIQNLYAVMLHLTSLKPICLLREKRYN